MIIFGVQGIIFPLELFPRFILHRANPPFCSRYIFSSPLLVQLAVQGRNLLETSFLSTSSPLRLPFNLFLRPFLRLRFRSSRPPSSSWIFSPDFFLVHSNFFFDLVFFLLIFHLFAPFLSKLFSPDPVSFPFPFPFHFRSSHISLSTTFHFKNFIFFSPIIFSFVFSFLVLIYSNTFQFYYIISPSLL